MGTASDRGDGSGPRAGSADQSLGIYTYGLRLRQHENAGCAKGSPPVTVCADDKKPPPPGSGEGRHSWAGERATTAEINSCSVVPRPGLVQHQIWRMRRTPFSREHYDRLQVALQGPDEARRQHWRGGFLSPLLEVHRCKVTREQREKGEGPSPEATWVRAAKGRALYPRPPVADLAGAGADCGAPCPLREGAGLGLSKAPNSNTAHPATASAG